MNLVHRTVAGQQLSLWQLESQSSAVDKAYAQGQGFEKMQLEVPGRGPQEIMARTAEVLPQGDIRLLDSSLQDDGILQRRSLQLQLPEGVRQLALFLPAGLDFNTVRVNDRLALQSETTQTDKKQRRAVVINRPAAGKLSLEIAGPVAKDGTTGSLEFPLRARFSLPSEVLEAELQGWPLDARPQHQGHRAEVDYLLKSDFK
jgi:hypothetical protein